MAPNPYIAELLGTILLVFLGDSVVANVSLNKAKGQGGGFLLVNIAWAFAVVVPALIFGPASGAHFNPALTIALAISGGITWNLVPGYIICQMIGGILGGCLVYLFYKDHFDATEDKATKLGVLCTAPAISNTVINFISEFIATFCLVFFIMTIGQTTGPDGMGTLNTFAVGGIIFVLGASLGGTTGYAINPARDLGPRIAHAILPIKGKGDSDWGYSWIPVAGPVCGGIVAAICAGLIFPA